MKVKKLTDEKIAEIAAKYFNDCEYPEGTCLLCDHCTEYWSALKALQILSQQERGENE